MLYELRVYQAAPGKLNALNDRFAQHTLSFFTKYGIEMLGFWTDVIGTYPNLTYIISFESMADREAKWSAFQADPDWLKVREESERDGPLLDRVRNTFMRLTPYSPEPKIDSSVHELRTYEVLPGKLPALHDRFANHTTALFKKHGMGVVGYWIDDVGTSNTLIYMLGYNSLADRERSWSTFAGDPEWHRVMAESDREHGTLERWAHNKVMQLIPYSPR